MAKAYLLLVFCLAPRIWAQAPAQSTARYTLRGSVSNSVTGEPIHKANVVLYGPEMKTVSTGPDGQFEIGGLQAGNYSVAANRQGFVDSRIGANPFATVQVGPDTSALAVKLVPFGRITGRVVDEDGEPVPNLSVQVMQRALQMGHASWQACGAGNTDESGTFTLESLQPGNYLVSIPEQQVYPGLAGEDRASRLIYRTEYYPNSPDMASAQPIGITGGESVQADLTVSEVQGSSIRFAVVPQQPWVQVILRNANGDEVNVPARRDERSGLWTVAGVSPGSWLLEVLANTNGQQVSGSAAVEVGDSDARNVVVTLSSAGDVPVLFSGESNSENGAPPAQLSLISPLGRVFGASPQNPSGGPGGNHYSVVGLAPGIYHVQLSVNGSHCVEAVTAGSADLARVDYVVPENGAAQPITVSMGSDCSTTSFSLNQSSGRFFFLIVVGGVHAREPLQLVGGPAAVAALAPGEYDVYAFSDANKIEYANPEVLRNYASRHISISSHQEASYKLDLNQLEGK